MTDLVERLRRWSHDVNAVPASDLMDEAADEITRLRAQGDGLAAKVDSLLQERQELYRHIATKQAKE